MKSHNHQQNGKPDPSALTKQADLVRLEQNMSALPIWAPRGYAKDYERNYPLHWIHEDARVTALATTKYGQLRAFDKIVLTALVHLWNEQGHDEDGRVSFQIIDIINALERENTGKLYQQIKASLNRLKFTGLEFEHGFRDREGEEWLSTQGFNILDALLLIEPRKRKGAPDQLAFTQFTSARLNLKLVSNLIANYTRPVSLKLLQRLTDRGVLFEAYVNNVLYRHSEVTKDVFSLWEDLGLSIKSIVYGSQLAQKMRRDLDAIKAAPDGLLGSYSFTKSKQNPKSQNLVLHRRSSAKKMIEEQGKPQIGEKRGDAFDRYVERIQFELGDKSRNDTNIRSILQRMPETLVWEAVQDAVGRKKDGLVRTNPVRYFIGRMKREAGEQGIDLGFQNNQSGEDVQAEPVAAEAASEGDGTRMDIPQIEEIGLVASVQKSQTDLDPHVKLKVDSYFITLPQREQEVLQDKAKHLVGADASEQDVLDQMRWIIAKQLRVGGDGGPQQRRDTR